SASFAWRKWSFYADTPCLSTTFFFFLQKNSSFSYMAAIRATFLLSAKITFFRLSLLHVLLSGSFSMLQCASFYFLHIFFAHLSKIVDTVLSFKLCSSEQNNGYFFPGRVYGPSYPVPQNSSVP
ncbi:MAG: hypothetical protein Q3990_06645, partial [Desulfovibrionaceae bacterium]|nr:hypothetical protein [Desulfovibrionaceae bacterium]